MNDLELLEKYEPVLRFAKSERFFPMAVESYLSKVSLFPSGPHGMMESVKNLNDGPLIEHVGKLKSEQHYLRFVNNPFSDSDIWIGWAVISLLAVVVTWLLSGRILAEISLAFSLLLAFVVFMVASPIRLRIIPAALAAFAFIVLEVAPIWFFMGPSNYMSIEVEYLILLPIYLLALFYLSVRTMKFILDNVILEGPGMIMDILSQATERVAQDAYRQYEEIVEKDPQPVYYGRVVREMDKGENQWTILQYHFFYAFNDWRLAAHGFNHHEGDWEMVAVYLKNDAPYAVLFSQHGAGNIEKWNTALKALDKQGNETTHPIVYVALGSHANYSRPDVIRSPSMYKPGRLQRLLFRLDAVIHYIFLVINPSQKAREIALKELQLQGKHFMSEDALFELRDEADHYVVSLPMEIASGDGLRIGFHGDYLSEGVMKSSSYLKRTMSDRKTTHPQVKEWRRVLLNPEPDWVQYKGLWGMKSLLKDESGPPGPKWDRPKKSESGVNERKRWGRPLDWLRELEDMMR